MKSHFVPACCIINNKGERTLFHCVLLCVGHETRDKVSYSLVMNYQVGQVIFQSMWIMHKEKKGTPPPLECSVDSSCSVLFYGQLKP